MKTIPIIVLAIGLLLQGCTSSSLPNALDDGEIEIDQESSCGFVPTYEDLENFPVRDNEAVLNGIFLRSEELDNDRVNILFGLLDTRKHGENYLGAKATGEEFWMNAPCGLGSGNQTILVSWRAVDSYFLHAFFEE